MRLVILHYHIFKNAGTTIENILDQSFGDRFLPLDVPGLEAPIPIADLVRHLDGRPSVAAVSSHQIRHPLPCVPGYLFFDICFFRDPLDRLRSTYDYYRIKPDPADPMSELAVRSSFRDFMAAMIRDFWLYTKNVQVNLLACRGDSDEPEEKDLRLAIRRVQETSFLGVVDLFDESVVAGEYALRRVFPELDCAIQAANVSRGFEGAVTDRSAQLREACGEDAYQELLRLNQLDFQLVEAARAEVRRRFQAVPDGQARLRSLADRRVKAPREAPAPHSYSPAATKYAASESHTRIERPLAYARGSGRSRDREGAVGSEYETALTKRCTKPERADFPTLLRRATKLAPYLLVLAGESRRILFDPEYYRQRRPQAGLGTLRPFLDFLLLGGFSGVAPHPLFDPAFYLRRNPDVARAGVNPLAHYLKHGAREGRQPHPLFDPAFYLEHAPDVRAAGQNPLVHYVLHGAAEGRQPHPLFDPEHYRKSAHLAPGSGGNPLIHFLEHGTDAASPHPLFDCDAWRAAHGEGAPESNPLVAYVLQHPDGPSPPVAFFDDSGELDWIAEPQQLPFLKALRPDQLRG